MKRSIANLALVVGDYDEAIRFYTEMLDFELVENSTVSETKRWVIVRPRNSSGCGLLLAKAVGERQRCRIGDQTGGRVFLFLETDDFDRDYNLYLGRGVEFVRPRSIEEYGTVAVFKDLYGNLWDLIEFSANK